MGRRLYKRAAENPRAGRSLWFIGEGVSTFAGPLLRNELHAHSVPVLLTGLAGPFRFRARGGLGWTICGTALVPAGMPYEFDMGGQPLSVIYLEPSVAGVEALVPLVSNREEMDGILVGKSDIARDLRSLYEDPKSGAWAGAALHDLVQSGLMRATQVLDPRVSRVVHLLQTSSSSDEALPVAVIAQSLGLSSSRFQHLFTKQVGVPYRRYRAWRRMLRAIREVAGGENFTSAAHTAGYSDQPHFVREFRRQFGAAPAQGLANVRT